MTATVEYMISNSIYYNGNTLLGYNEPFMFCIGNRSTGKSFFYKSFCVKRFLNHNEKFIYLRRYDNELNKIKTFFSDIAFKFPDVSFSVKGRSFYINDKLCGYAIPLSLAYKVKSVSFNDVGTIMYDEFLPENNRYIPDEFSMALNLYQSVARGGGKVIRDDVRFIFIGNHVSLLNPYFEGLGARIYDNSKYIRGDGYVIEIFNNEEVSEIIKNSKVGRILFNNEYGNYALNGKFIDDNNQFIKRTPRNSKYLLTIKYDGYECSLLRCENGYHISNKIDKDFPYRYAFSNSDHSLNYTLINRYNKSSLMESIRVAYSLGELSFSDKKCKKVFLDIMKYK